MEAQIIISLKHGNIHCRFSSTIEVISAPNKNDLIDFDRYAFHVVAVRYQYHDGQLSVPILHFNEHIFEREVDLFVCFDYFKDILPNIVIMSASPKDPPSYYSIYRSILKIWAFRHDLVDSDGVLTRLIFAILDAACVEYSSEYVLNKINSGVYENGLVSSEILKIVRSLNLPSNIILDDVEILATFIKKYSMDDGDLDGLNDYAQDLIKANNLHQK